MRVPPIFFRPLDTALFYAVVPPLVGVALLALGTGPIAAWLGRYPWETILFLLAGGYLYGAPPLALTGIAASLSARAGSSFPSLVAISAACGFLFAGLVAASAALFWWNVAGWQIVLGLAAAGSTAGAGAALTLGLLAGLRDRAKDLPA